MNATEEAHALLGNGFSKRGRATAMIVAPDGTELFRIVSTRWTRIVTFGYGLMLTIITILAILMFYNKSEIIKLEKKVDQQAVPPIQTNE